MSQRHDELETMTELAAFLMALMLTVELDPKRHRLAEGLLHTRGASDLQTSAQRA
jgi:hypothetical protein